MKDTVELWDGSFVGVPDMASKTTRALWAEMWADPIFRIVTVVKFIETIGAVYCCYWLAQQTGFSIHSDPWLLWAFVLAMIPLVIHGLLPWGVAIAIAAPPCGLLWMMSVAAFMFRLSELGYRNELACLLVPGIVIGGVVLMVGLSTGFYVLP